MIIDRSFSPVMEKVFSGHRLGREEVGALVDAMVDGTMSDARIAAVLTGLRFAPLSQDVMMGALEAILRHVEHPRLDDVGPLVDCSGTGGDGSSTVNISTMAAVVAASAGAKVAKFGSRSVTSKCGSADVLEAQGVRLSTTLEECARELRRVGVSFLYAPAFYTQLRHISLVRKSLGFHTIFDILVPLANPLVLHGQLLGVYSKDLQVVAGRCLAELGRKRALVVHSDDGLDEISVCGPTQVLKVQETLQGVEIWKPQDFGLRSWPLSDLRGGGVEENVRAFATLLDGKGEGAIADACLLNAAGVLWCAGLVDEVSDGLERAKAAVASGRARVLFEEWRGHARTTPGGT